MQKRTWTFIVSAWFPKFCETNMLPTRRECGAGEGLHGPSHRAWRHDRRRPHGCGKGRRNHSAIGEIVGTVLGLGQFVKRLMAAAGREPGELDVLLDRRHRRYRRG